VSEDTPNITQQMPFGFGNMLDHQDGDKDHEAEAA